MIEPKKLSVAQKIKILQDAGVSKYRLAQELGTTWNTVHLWSRGVFTPKKRYQIRTINRLIGEVTR